MRGFVVIEGLIGVGKTSLCRALEAEHGARLVLEPAETNPFLELFYGDPARYALPVQLTYLLQRWRQQDRIRQGDLFGPFVVSDYCFAKDRLFAEKTLAPDELGVYEQVERSLGARAPTPDLLVYLEAPLRVIQERILRRNAPGERAITAAYLEDLAARYETLLARWRTSPVLRIDNAALDVIGDDAARTEIFDRIGRALAGARADREAPYDAQPSLFPVRSR
jgi:deoxyadenosine/deoxycytidine kinase